MAYNLFKSNDVVTPFVIVSDNTIDSTSTSVFLIGRRKEAYGGPQDQSVLWMLENFANSTPPVNPINGQGWYNTTDEQLYVCVDELTSTFEKVSNPLVSASAPSLNLTQGNLWYDNVNSRLYAWDGAQWDLIGPASSVPLSVQEIFFLNRITSNATTSELWLNGITNSRLVIPNNTDWLFEITLVARRTDVSGERRSFRVAGMLDNTANTVTLDPGMFTEFLSQSAGTSNYAVSVSADNVNKSLLVQVTGEVGKTIVWDLVVKLTKVA